jgi:hypothetical protein
MRRFNRHTGPVIHQTWAILTTLIFLVIFSATPVLHNHEPSLVDHTDCPSFQLTLLLVAEAAGFQLALSPSLPEPDRFLSISTDSFSKQTTCRFFINRAPPIG